MLCSDMVTTTGLQAVEQMTGEPRPHDARASSSVNYCGPKVLNAYNLSSRKLKVNRRVTVWTA